MAKINVSVSSNSSKPNVTVSKGPVGPQGEQGIQGEAGPQGVEGSVSSVNDIPEFDIDLDVNNLDVTVLPTGSSVSTRSSRYLVWDPSVNKVVLNEDGAGVSAGYIFTAASGSPRPSGQFVTGNVASTNGGSLDGIDTANGVVSINHSGQIDNSLNLYVNGDTRVNGVIQVGTDSTTAYSLPSADGTANQILKTDGNGVISFTGNYADLDGDQVVTGTKLFTAKPVLSSGLRVSNGGIDVTGASQLGSATFSGNLTAQQLTFANNGTSIIAPTTVGALLPDDLEIRSNGNILIKLDTDNNESAQKFIVADYNDAERFSVQEDGAVRISNAYTLPSSDGATGQFLKTDGSGNISFAAASSLALGTTSTTALAGDTTTITPSQASAITSNTAKTGITPTQAGEITANTAKVSYTDAAVDSRIGAASIDDLSDVDTTTTLPADGQALVWNNTNSEWEPGDVGIDGISSEYSDSEIPQNWYADSSQIIGVGSFNTSGTEIAFGEGHPRDLFFKPDGTRMFVVGNGLNDIQSVDLPTAWDLSSIDSTATVTTVDLLGSSSIGGKGHEGSLYNMHVANDPSDTATYGKKFFISGDGRDEVQEYTCTTAWDLSTMSGTPTAYLDIGATSHGSSVYSITFNPDGSIMYIGRAGNPNTFSHFDLSTSWDLSTAVYNASKSTTISVISTAYSNPEGYVINVCFNTDGTKAYFSGRTRHDLHATTLSTAWDLSTYTDDQTPLHLGGGYIEQAFGYEYPSWDQQNFQWPSGLFSTPDYFYILFNTNDQIIRLDKKYYELDLESRVSNKAVFQSGLRSYGEVEVIGTVECSGFRTGGNAYFSGAMNWNGFNSGPITTGHNMFKMGTAFKSISFVNSGQPQAFPAMTSIDVNNTTPGTHIVPSSITEACNIILPLNSGEVLLDTTPDLYYNKFNTESASKITGATEDIEYYYTARTDGQGLHKRALGAFPAAGQTLTRTSYYSNKAFADPDTASDWTQGTVYSSTSLDSAISQSTDALLNAQSTGTPPLSTKIVIANRLGPSGLLIGDSNGFGGTSVAYSLRLVNNTYAGAAIRVVNDSAVETDIGFDSSLELDTTALLSHCGSGDGYIVKWYDQAKGGSTGDGNDATWESSTSYSSRKPKIVSAGSVITDNGKPCLETIDAGMVMDEQFSASNEYDLFFVAQKTLNDNNHGMIWGTQTGNDCRVWLYDYRLYLEVNDGENNNDGYGEGGANTNWHQMGQLVLNVRRDGSDVNTAQRNDVVGDHNYTRNGAMQTDRILNAWNNKVYSFAGNVQEIIMLDGDKSSERSAILSNLNTYYSIY